MSPVTFFVLALFFVVCCLIEYFVVEAHREKKDKENHG